MSRAYVVMHYILGLLLFISAPSTVIIKTMLTALYAVLVPQFFIIARNGDRDLGFLGYFTLAAYPFFAVTLYLLDGGVNSRSLLALALSSLLSVTAMLSYRRGFPKPVLEVEETNESAIEREESPADNTDLEAYISSIEGMIREEREKSERLKEKTKEIREKIDSLLGAVG